MSAAGTFTTGLTIAVEDGYGEHGAKATLTYSFAAGSPESGRFGPPENYDPGSGDEVHISSATVDGEPAPKWLLAIFNKDEELLRAIAIRHGEDEQSAREDAKFQAWKDRDL